MAPLHCILLLMTFLVFSVRELAAIHCYACRSDDTTCNIGECHGLTCIKMETVNMDTERRTVYKSCTEEYEETHCSQSAFGNKLNTRCACDTNFCNGDRNLVAAGLESSGNGAADPTTILHLLSATIPTALFVLLPIVAI